MNRIVFTGTASGFPARDRACSSLVLQLGDKLYQFDAGEGISGSVQRLKIDYNQIGKIFVSHLHPDHITGLFLELQMMYLAKRQMPLDIYVPEEGAEPLEKAVRLFYLFKEKFPFSFHFQPIKPNPVFCEKDFALYAYPNRHLTPNREIIEKTGAPNKMQSYSYVLKIVDKRILYSGDIKDEHDLDGLLDDTHTVITEGMHCDFEALVANCADKGVKRLVVTHLQEKQYTHPQTLLKIAAKYKLGKILIAQDGLRLAV
jgi:ribonuclease BN (tRNA processing enzyme)